MDQTKFEMDMENLSAQAFAAWDTAGILLAELAKATGGDTAKLEKIKSDILNRYTDMSEKGDFAAAGKDKESMERAARQTVESIFDRVSITDQSK